MSRILYQNTKEIDTFLGRQVKIYKAGESIKIICETEAEKKQLKQNLCTLVQFEIEYSEPYIKKRVYDEQSHLKRGIIFGVDESYTDEEIAEAAGAKTAKRIIKKIGETQVQTRQIILTFDEYCPTYVQLGWERHRVEIFIPNPIRCYNCQRFGHLAKFCTAEVRCSRCAENHSVHQCLQNEKEIKILCANCNGQHPASYMGCKKYQLAKETTKIQFSETKKMSYAQAAMKVKEIRSKETNQENQKNQISDRPNQEIENYSNKVHYKNDKATNTENKIDQVEILTMEKAKEKSNKNHEDCHCHTNCVDKQIFLNFLDECKTTSLPNQSNVVTLQKLFNAISKLADIIRGSNSSSKESTPIELCL